MTAAARDLVQRALARAKAISSEDIQASGVFDTAALLGIQSLAAVGQRDVERLAIYGASKGLYAAIHSKSCRDRLMANGALRRGASSGAPAECFSGLLR